MRDRFPNRIEKVGTVLWTAVVDGVQSMVYIRDLFYVPEVPINFLSVSWIRRKGLEVSFKDSENGSGLVFFELRKRRIWS